MFVGKFKDIIGLNYDERKEWIAKVKSSTEGFTNLELVLLKTIEDMIKEQDRAERYHMEDFHYRRQMSGY
jgi:hypothetical protein